MTADERERLILRYKRLAEASARRVCRRWGVPVTDDLVSEAYIALIRAIDSFDPSKGAALTTHIITRARGAVHERLRTDMGIRTKPENRPRAVVPLEWLTSEESAWPEPASPYGENDLLVGRMACADELSDTKREALRMVADGHSPVDASRALGKSRNWFHEQVKYPIREAGFRPSDLYGWGSYYRDLVTAC